jgi:hypothetical protein
VDRVTAVATTILELLGLLLVGLSSGVALAQHWGLPAGLLGTGIAYVAASAAITALRRPAAPVTAGADA